MTVLTCFNLSFQNWLAVPKKTFKNRSMLSLSSFNFQDTKTSTPTSATTSSVTLRTFKTMFWRFYRMVTVKELIFSATSSWNLHSAISTRLLTKGVQSSKSCCSFNRYLKSTTAPRLPSGNNFSRQFRRFQTQIYTELSFNNSSKLC